MWDGEATWLEKLRYFLERKGGYEIVSALLESDKTEAQIVDETGGPESTVHAWLQAAGSVGLVQESHSRIDGTVVTTWSLDVDRIPDDAIPIIESRGAEWRDGRTYFANTTAITQFHDGHDINEALGLSVNEEG